MKNLITVLLAGLLVGCSNNGIGPDFKKETTEIFLGVDELVEQYEPPVMVYEPFHEIKRNKEKYSEEEQEVIELISTMFSVGMEWYENPDETDIDEYLYARERAANLLDIDIHEFQDTGVDTD